MLVTDGDQLETLDVLIEVRRGDNQTLVAEDLAIGIKRSFEITPRIQIIDLGTLAKQFESSIKAPRFVDRRD